MAQLCDADWPGRRELYDACLFPLDHIKTHPLEDYQFEPIPNKPDHFILYVEFPEPLTLEYNRNPHTLEYTDNIVVTDSAPALFDIYGYIAVQDCFMSVGADHGIRGVQGTNAPATVSCWFEIGTHLTINNQIQWDRYRAGMKQLVEISGFSYDEASLSKLISEDSKGNMRIRVCKEVTPGHEVCSLCFIDIEAV